MISEKAVVTAVPNTISPSTISPTANTISPEEKWLTEAERQRLASVRAFREMMFTRDRMNEYDNFGHSQTEKTLFWEEFMKLTPTEARDVMSGSKRPNISIDGIDSEHLTEEQMRNALLKLWIERKKKGEI